MARLHRTRRRTHLARPMTWRAAYLRARKARQELRAGGQCEEGAAPAAPVSLDLAPGAASAASGVFSLTEDAFHADYGPYPNFDASDTARERNRATRSVHALAEAS